nr:adenosine deaminase 2-A [Helicoverpa armigera]
MSCHRSTPQASSQYRVDTEPQRMCNKMRSIILVATLFVYATCDDNYNEKRKQLIDLELKLSLGGNTTLSDKENAVNYCLMNHKFDEINYGFDHPDRFNLSHHFFTFKNQIQNSKVYKIIKNMPKGAILHVHDMAIIGPDYFVNLTYMDNLYVCLDKPMRFWFSNKTPNMTCDVAWQLMSSVRRTAANVTEFDAQLRKQFTLVCDNPDVVYPTIKESWTRFMQYFGSVYPLLAYRPNWERYFYDALKFFRDDKVMYVEVRSILPDLYELDGTVYDKTVTAKAYRKVIKKFVRDYPDFIGAKLIFAPSRKVDRSVLDTYIQLARKLKREMPDFLAGFDLVGPEDAGNPLIEFVPQLLQAQDLNFFFHAGETNWYGTLTDENLIDAVLLGAKRIGHGYALAKHPVLIREVVQKDIGIEVNVLSNAILSLVKDVRNHPLNIFLSMNLPVVLSSDDPGAWEADPLSDDFYVAFVGVASRLADLRMLKTLALNSLKYSALDPVNKARAISVFHTQWNSFIDNFDCKSY